MAHAKHRPWPVGRHRRAAPAPARAASVQSLPYLPTQQPRPKSYVPPAILAGRLVGRHGWAGKRRDMDARNGSGRIGFCCGCGTVHSHDPTTTHPPMRQPRCCQRRTSTPKYPPPRPAYAQRCDYITEIALATPRSPSLPSTIARPTSRQVARIVIITGDGVAVPPPPPPPCMSPASLLGP